MYSSARTLQLSEKFSQTHRAVWNRAQTCLVQGAGGGIKLVLEHSELKT